MDAPTAAIEVTGRNPSSGTAAMRARAYRVLSACMLPPDDDRIASLADSLPAIHEVTEVVRGLTVAPAWARLVRAIENDISSPERWRVGYTSMFLSGSPSRGVAPYESSYVVAPGQLDGPKVSADVETSYRRAGLIVGGRFGGELPDHIATELDFLAVLCDRESCARDDDEERRLRAMQLSFLRDHLLRWVEPFARGVAKVDPSSVCAAAAGAAEAFAAHDVALLEMLG